MQLLIKVRDYLMVSKVDGVIFYIINTCPELFRGIDRPGTRAKKTTICRLLMESEFAGAIM
jgi:hypothetical protein